MRRLSGCDIEFNAITDEMHFDPAVLALRLINADPFPNEIIAAMGEEALSIRISNSSAFRTLAENTIVPLLPHAEASARLVASRIGMSERTLARRLAEEGLSFGEILNEMRRDTAIRYLEENNLQTSQIAWLLGFHQSSSFSHAFRRWTGKSPSEFRPDSFQSPVRSTIPSCGNCGLSLPRNRLDLGRHRDVEFVFGSSPQAIGSFDQSALWHASHLDCGGRSWARARTMSMSQPPRM